MSDNQQHPSSTASPLPRSSSSKRPLQFRQTARRLQLQVQHTWQATTSPSLHFTTNNDNDKVDESAQLRQNLSSHGLFEAPIAYANTSINNSNTNINMAVGNIDEALQSLYQQTVQDDADDEESHTAAACQTTTTQSKRRPSCSFVARLERDWLLDGHNNDASANTNSNAMDDESVAWTALLYPAETRNEWLTSLLQQVQQIERHESASDNESGGDEDDDDFGDFQSAGLAIDKEAEAVANNMATTTTTTEGACNKDTNENDDSGDDDCSSSSSVDTTNMEAAKSARIPEQQATVVQQNESATTPDNFSLRDSAVNMVSQQHEEEDTPDLIHRASHLLAQARNNNAATEDDEQPFRNANDRPLPLLFASPNVDDLPCTPVLVQQTQELLEAAAAGRVSTPSPRHHDAAVHNAVAWSPVRPVYLEAVGNQSHGDDQAAEAAVPISLQLPVTDLSTIEGRFQRRRQLWHASAGDNRLVADQEEKQELQEQLQRLEELPRRYFGQPNLDDTGRVLAALPWQYVQETLHGNTSASNTATTTADFVLDYATSDWALWDEHMTDQLCRLDGALETVQGQLLRQVQPHEAQLTMANERIHEWEQNLRLGFMYWERANESLQLAIGSKEDATGVAGSSILVDLWQDRQDHEVLSTVLDQAASVLAEEQEVCNRIDSFDARQDNAVDEYHALMKQTRELQATVCDGGPLSELGCLDDMRVRLGTIRKRFWHRLHVLSESVAVRCCRGMTFDWAEYESLVRSVLDLHSQGLDEDSPDDVDLGKSWSDNILDALCYEADRAFAIALLDPVDAGVSKFEKELMQLAREINTDWGDGAKLRTLRHNLVTIRFDFECEANYLPRVFQRLCTVLSEVLHSHFMFTQWHAAPFDDKSRSTGTLHEVRETPGEQGDGALDAIDACLKDSRSRLWDHCERVIVKCFEEYLNFAARRKLFDQAGDVTEDSAWVEDLQGLHQVLLLSDRFVSLKSSFFEDAPTDTSLVSLWDATEEWSLYDKLTDIFRKHLRSVHVEAMNSLGRLLANETWRLTSFALPTDTQTGNGEEDQTVEGLLFGALKAASSFNDGGTAKTSWTDLVATDETHQSFMRFAIDGNPFDDTDTTSVQFSGFDADSFRTADTTPPSGLYETLSELIQEGDTNGARIASESVSRGLVVWVSRLLTVMERLPLIVEDISAVFANLCDLYFATVLRVCVGTSRDEKILLGIEPPTPLHTSSSDVAAFANGRKSPRPKSPPLFGFGRKEPPKSRYSSLPPVAIPLSLEADISAPLPRDEPATSQLKHYIQRAQRSLLDIVNLDRVGQWLPDPVHADETIEEHACAVARTLEKREAALCNCYVVAALFDVACSMASTYLSSPFLRGKFSEESSLLQSFVRATTEITPTFVAVASQMSCARAVGGLEIVKEIVKVGAGWEEHQLNEDPNDYIDDLCDRCALIWGYMAASSKLPKAIMKMTWEQILASAYLSLLEGFARVPFCSTEGRAMMTLDLASFSAGTGRTSIAERLEGQALPSSIPKVNPDRGMRYVDTYIKVFYYPKEDAVRWIEHNVTNYHLNHSIALVTATGDTTSPSSDESKRDLVEYVKSLYRDDRAREDEEKKV